MPTSDLSSRVALVTGASAGIGRAIARDLAAAGCRLVVNARRRDRLEALALQCGTDRTRVVAGDAAEDSVIDAMLDAAAAGFGREADLVVVNAGRGLRGGLYESDPAQWEEVVRINLLGAARLMRAAVRRMESLAPADAPLALARDVVVLGSSVGRHVSPFSSFYGAAKAGVHMLAESLRRVAGPKGIRVTLLEPGVVRSEFQEAAQYEMASFGQFMDRIGPVLTPDDVSRLVMFIVSQPPGVHVNDVMIRPTRQEYP